VHSLEEAQEAARIIGFPVILKASGGGGGRGMRIAHNEPALANAFTTAQSEARIAFKSSDVYVEKLVEKGRHVEVQILGDQKGNVIHLGERDCSSQRRYQKLVEESPAPGVSDQVRSCLHEAAVKLARATNYHSAGTVEFLLAANGEFYFLEMNTRVQVEHPVTEMVTGVDIVAEQIRVAAGETLRYQQTEIVSQGHAIECRINAEDPSRNFTPCPGWLETFHQPGGPGIRVDTHAYTDYRIPPNYDSLIAKLVAYAPTRAEAIARMRRALEEFVIEGIHTTIPFHQRLMNHPFFIDGKINTGYVEEILAQDSRSEA
jgi:acetyl-CoA carboxylase biotin carboxylase subunit